jgi:hypothetical protein
VILAIGQRAFINRPGDAALMVSLTDERGVPAATLSDGVEVEIIAWRPRGSTGTRYRVRNHSDGSDGWRAAEELRTTALRPPAPEPIARATSSPTGYYGPGRPFGSRL